MSSLPTKNDKEFIAREIPLGIAGCYVFIGKYDTVLYVGQSVCLRSRLYDHLRLTEYMNEVEKIDIYLTTDRFKLEMLLIGKLSPLYNRRVVQFKKATTLYRE